MKSDTPRWRVSELLTAVTILLSAATLGWSWWSYEDLWTRERAATVKVAAAKALAKAERWKVLSLSIYQEMQPAFISASRMLESDASTSEIRDFLWRVASQKRAQILGRLLQERLETGYADLYAYHPSVRELYIRTMQQLRKEEDEAFSELAISLQADVLDFASDGEESMGEVLRRSATRLASTRGARIDRILGSVTQFLSRLIGAADEEVLRFDSFREGEIVSSGRG